MSESNPTELRRLADRVTEFEELFTHLQQTVHELNEVLLATERENYQLRRELDRVTAQVRLLTESASSGSDLPDEPPPHY